MIARGRHKARRDVKPVTLKRKWRLAVNRLLVVMLLGGAVSLSGTIWLVSHSSDTAHRVEAEARVFAQLRADIVTGTIALSGAQGPRSGTALAAAQAAIKEGFMAAHAAALSPAGQELLRQAQTAWSAAMAKIQTLAQTAPLATRAAVIGQVLSGEAPKVLTQLDQAGAAGRAAVRRDLQEQNRESQATLVGLAALTFLGLVLVKRLGRQLTREVLEPVSVLHAAADRFAAGDFNHAAAVAGGDEIGLLATSLNDMADAVAGSHRRLTLQASQDSLTGLANRTGFREKAGPALARPDRREGEQALLFIDLDDFKNVNDLLGHGAGDELLRVVATRLADVVRPGDLVARLGGDEFAVHLDQVPSPHAAFELAERMVATLRQPIVLLGHAVQVGASVGLAMAHGGSDLDQLMQEADMAMYSAKGRGKNRVECYDASLHQALADHHTLRADVAFAVARGELVIEYQPVVDLTSGVLNGVEALVRWQHPTRGLLPPSAFVELAEQTGAMPEMGKWVLETAIARMDSWQRRYDRPDLTLAVNVSAHQLTQAGFVSAVAAALADTLMRPETLTLEVTESMLVDESSPVPQALRDLRELGLRVALDDFGTGYASIPHLKLLPIDVLKIDRSFVVNAREDSRSEVLLGGLVKLATHLGLDVIPEGVEVPEDLLRLHSMGCRQAQGFLFARPLPPADVEEWLIDPTKPLPLELSELPPFAELPVPRPTIDDAADRIL